MLEQNSTVRFDLDSQETMTAALVDLVNQFPALGSGEEIAFSTLGEASGKAMFPISGAVIESETESITGHVVQYGLYPFMVVFRTSATSESRKMKAKEWLDDLGKWLERQPVTIQNTEFRLTEYPELPEGQSFVSVTRQTPGYLEAVNPDQSEDWQIYISARYRKEFDR